VESVEGSEALFPHIYGPLPLDAVTESTELLLSDDGRLEVEALVADC
jgi:uncharacterized protein (DUF952 family)